MNAIKEQLTVKNITVLSPLYCRSASWLKHWEAFAAPPLPAFCSETFCREKPEVGVLVQRSSSKDIGWYVIPVCNEHSCALEPLKVFTFLIPATFADVPV
jgi:hypothetical protein